MLLVALLPFIELTPEPVLAAVVIHAVSHTLSWGAFEPHFRWRRDRTLAIAAALALLSAGRQTHLRAISRLRDGGLERAGWNAEEGEKLALQLGQLQVEELDGAAVLEQMVALGQAEQAQHLLGGGVRALALLGVDG